MTMVDQKKSFDIFAARVGESANMSVCIHPLRLLSGCNYDGVMAFKIDEEKMSSLKKRERRQ